LTNSVIAVISKTAETTLFYPQRLPLFFETVDEMLMDSILSCRAGRGIANDESEASCS
jgi:hypothetical protein